MLFIVMLLCVYTTQAQLNIQSGAVFMIQTGATVTVQGDLTANTDVQGPGTLLMKGTAAQNINMNGFSIPNLQIDNTNNITLTGNTRVSSALTFVNGKISLGTNTFTLASGVVPTGAGTGKFLETNGTGKVQQELAGNGNFTLPVGIGTKFTPVVMQVSGASGFSTAKLMGHVTTGGHPNKHPRSTDFINEYWTLGSTGITGGTVTGVGTYNDPTDVTGTESVLRAMTWNGTNWSMASASQDNTTNTVTGPVSGASTDLYAMNRFLLVTPKVFLQGAFNSGTGFMNDLLRNSGAYSPGNPSPSNLIPTTDPYRSAPYNTNFTHVNNPVTETIASSVLFDQASATDNIVDWVFIELRNNAASPGNTVQQTRSALLQRDGDIVDIDGVSPIYFKDIDPTNYVIAIRHRNHLGISITPSAAIGLSLTSTAFDFSTASAATLNGTSGLNYTVISSKNMMWAGNANGNANVLYNSPGNDRAVILTSLPGGTGDILNNVYHQCDLNMDRKVLYNSPGNDRAFMLANVLAGVTGAIVNQSLPN